MAENETSSTSFVAVVAFAATNVGCIFASSCRWLPLKRLVDRIYASARLNAASLANWWTLYSTLSAWCKKCNILSHTDGIFEPVLYGLCSCTNRILCSMLSYNIDNLFRFILWPILMCTSTVTAPVTPLWETNIADGEKKAEKKGSTPMKPFGLHWLYDGVK